MAALLKLSRWIDSVNEFVGRWLAWLVLAAVLISAANAAVRKAFDMSSNAFLEIQWYLFAAVFLVASGYTLLRQEHVKIDVVLHRFTRPTQIKVEIFGIVAFLIPFVLTVSALVWPLVTKAYIHGEMSSNAGGLIRWPVFAMTPLVRPARSAGGVELIKRVTYDGSAADDQGEETGRRRRKNEAIRLREEGVKQ